MDNPPESGARFIGTIEHLLDGWRASFGVRVPGDVFTQPGETEFFATELQATKCACGSGGARVFVRRTQARGLTVSEVSVDVPVTFRPPSAFDVPCKIEGGRFHETDDDIYDTRRARQ
jgi:hypothetical protein